MLSSDAGHTSILVLLYLSAAFDTTDHDIILDHFLTWVGTVAWLCNGLGPAFYIGIAYARSAAKVIYCGCPKVWCDTLF